MSDICVTCGLPKDLCVCETIAKESQRITIRTVNKKFRKEYTIIEGVDVTAIDTKELVKQLKNKFACGGTIKGGIIGLQGNHKKEVREYLVKLGFAAETIEIK